MRRRVYQCLPSEACAHSAAGPLLPAVSWQVPCRHHAHSRHSEGLHPLLHPMSHCQRLCYSAMPETCSALRRLCCPCCWLKLHLDCQRLDPYWPEWCFSASYLCSRAVACQVTLGPSCKVNKTFPTRMQLFEAQMHIHASRHLHLY